MHSKEIDDTCLREFLEHLYWTDSRPSRLDAIDVEYTETVINNEEETKQLEEKVNE